uniref:Uncharacterized protein n=1 Tax=Klebsiella pneumoniae TaxID=573 RepID=A0A6G9HST6_KLEPN|nr:hypothetical protein [Klebsiella pneumoniae]QIQ14101.1 hypothetical protein [Klebsiella pneumoniae]URZ93647.1 hypothetical protein [Klebsiella pneumoniae]WMW26869.1 hypothetical protein [Escherichia coli]
MACQVKLSSALQQCQVRVNVKLNFIPTKTSITPQIPLE